jgi:hypothetical protein
VVSERVPQPALLQHGDHGLRRMREDAELATPEAKAGVLDRDDEAREPVARRVAEDEQAPGVVGRGREEPLVVGVAAHDSSRLVVRVAPRLSSSSWISPSPPPISSTLAPPTPRLSKKPTICRAVWSSPRLR